MPLYAGLDLHANSNYLAIVAGDGKRVFKKKLPNDPQQILEALRPYQGDLVGLVVESTFNLYWLVDTLMAEGYKVHLANPSAIQQYAKAAYYIMRNQVPFMPEKLFG